MTDIIEAINNRFPNAEFVISCFKTIEEIQTKIVSTEDTILFVDEFSNTYYSDKENTHIHLPPSIDYFIITKKEGRDAIYCSDVIDDLIMHNFVRNDCDHKFLEKFVIYNKIRRNEKSIQTYCASWGS